MNSECGKLPAGDLMPDDDTDDASRQAKLEQRLLALFHLAGDGEPARQLLRMVIDYRGRQPQ